MTEQSAGKTGKAGDRQSAPAVPNPVVIGIGGGVAAGIASSFIPMTAIEGFVSAYGIAELLPAAAPPLGNTARLALSTGIGTLTAGALLALLPRGETNDMGFESTATKPNEGSQPAKAPLVTKKSAKPAAQASGGKFAGWLRTLRFGKAGPTPGTVKDFADIKRSRIRAEDQHPDAPVRAPILASSDLGEPLGAPVAERAPAQPIPPFAMPKQPFDLGEDLALASAPEPVKSPLRFAPPAERAPIFAAPANEPAATPLDTPAPEAAKEFLPEVKQSDPEPLMVPEALAMTETPKPIVAKPASAPAPRQADDLDQLSIAGLLERLETGLQWRMGQGSAGNTEKTAHDSRLIRLAEVEPAQVAAVPSDSAPEEPEAPSQPVRFRVESPADIDIAAQMPFSPFGQDDSWHGEIEYQEPVVSSDVRPAPEDARPLPVIEDAAPIAPAAAADDDMDAALRDALATLRQLSDRQRNV